MEINVEQMWNYQVWLSKSDTEIPRGFSCENKINWNKENKAK